MPKVLAESPGLKLLVVDVNNSRAELPLEPVMAAIARRTTQQQLPTRWPTIRKLPKR